MLLLKLMLKLMLMLMLDNVCACSLKKSYFPSLQTKKDYFSTTTTNTLDRSSYGIKG